MKPVPIDLDGAVVAITGAGRGIGRSTALEFARRGARVCLGDLDSDTAQLTAGEIGEAAEPYAVDVSDEVSFAEFVSAVHDSVGPIDVLVNNAGIMPAGRFLDESARTARTMIDVNVHGPITGMKLVLPGMLARGRGHVVNVASGAGRFEIPGLATYCASKHAVVGLSGTVRRELDGTGVTVSAVLPSAVQTELSSGIAFPFERFAKVSPDAVARAIVKTVEDRPREVTVPSWIAHYNRVAVLLPEPVEKLVRSLIDDTRALTQVDAQTRAAYVERLERQGA